MKKRLIILLLITLFLFPFVNKVKTIIIKADFFYNSQANNLVQNVIIAKDTNYGKLLSKQIVKFEFKANDNNLGTISFLFNNYSKINSDVISFRIKEKGSSTWYHLSSHDTSKLDIGQFYPFGFTPIFDSKDHIYQIEIESQKGSANDSVSVSEKPGFFQAKYIYTKAYLSQNKSLLPHFLITKTINYLSYFKYSDYLSLSFLFASPLLIYLFFIGMLRVFNHLFPKKLNMKIDFFTLIKNFIKSNKAILSIIVVYIATRIQFLKYSQYWDANLYWNALLGAIDSLLSTPINLSDLARSFLTNFNVLGHISMGYMGIMSLSQLFDRGNVIYLNIENLFLAAAAIWAFYNIVRFFYPAKTFENVLITLIFAFNPLFYATSIAFNTDFPLLVFTTLVIEAFIKKRKFWVLFWSLMLIFSKVTGVLIFFLLILSYLAVSAFNRHFILRWKKGITQILVFCLPILAFGLYYFTAHGQLWINNDYAEFNYGWNSSCNFCLGLNEINIKVRLFQIFIMNFSWILSLIIFVSSIKSLITRSSFFGKLSKEISNFIVVLILTFLGFVSFNLITIVMNFPRYVVAGVIFLIIIFYLALENLISTTKIRILILAVVFSLMFIQTFNAIDPSPQHFYGTNYLGNHKSSPIFAFNDAQVYNSQFTFLDGYTDLINKNSPKGTCIVNDLATSYYFRNLRNIGPIENLDKLKNKNCNEYIYVYVPWMSNEKTVHVYEGKIYTIDNSENLDYKGYPVILYHLQPI